MAHGCTLICEGCKKRTLYIRKMKNFCHHCGKEQVLEEEIEDLVVALNKLGVVTVASFVGIRNGFDSNKWSHPCVFLLIDKENIAKAEELIKKYNRNTSEKSWWVVKRARLTIEVEAFIAPLHKERKLEELQRETKRLAALI